MSQRPGGPSEDGPLPRHLDPRRGRPRSSLPPRPGRASTPPPAPDGGPLPPELDPRGRRGPGPRPDAPPPPRGRRGRSGRRKAVRRVALLLAAVVALTAVTFLGALVYYDRRIDRVAVPSLDGSGGEDTNYLIVGNDSRRGLTDEELAQVRATAKEGGDSSLTDTILLAHVPSGGGSPTFVSFPRDSWVEIPGGGRGRINTAHAIGERSREGGGPAKLVETVEQLSGLAIDHYVEVGMIAFLRITEAVGGVEVDLCGAVSEPDSGIELPAGEQRIQGGDALAFVRQRKGLPRGDLDRVARQQYFLASVARQVLSPTTVLRPDRVLSLVGAVTSSIRADEDLSTFGLAHLAWRLRGAANGGLAFQTVPVADANANKGGASVVLLDEEALPGFFAGLSAEPAAPPPSVAIAPTAIRLRVLNGTGESGLASRAKADLERQGFTVTDTGNADRTTTRTVVLHGSNRADSARTVAASVPGAQVRQDDGQGASGLTLVVGDDYDGVQPVTVAAPAGQAPAPAGAPAPPAEQPEGAQRPCIV
jgi:LCP family protein required for cell wall assembly